MIMSKEKYPSIFLCQMQATVYISFKFFATCADLKLGEYPLIFPNFNRGIFGHVTCLDQS